MFSLIVHKITGKIIINGQAAMHNAAVYRKGHIIIPQKYGTL